MSVDDWVKLIAASASAFAVILAAIGGVYVQVRKYHAEVNSRMGELLELTRSSSLAQGRLEGAAAPGEPPEA